MKDTNIIYQLNDLKEEIKYLRISISELHRANTNRAISNLILTIVLIACYLLSEQSKDR